MRNTSPNDTHIPKYKTHDNSDTKDQQSNLIGIAIINTINTAFLSRTSPEESRETFSSVYFTIQADFKI